MALEKINITPRSVTIMGGAGFSELDLKICSVHAPTLVAADGGANYVNEEQYHIDYIIGDLDSVENKTLWESQGTTIIKISEQETTDFEKCLYSVNAHFYFCLGFIGGRADHFLAVCSSVIKYHFKKIILVGNHDVIFHVPRLFEIDLPIETRLSLFPMRKITAINESGLRWPLSGLEFNPVDRVGTSNITEERKIKMSFSDEGMLMILPNHCLPSAIAALEKCRLYI